MERVNVRKHSHNHVEIKLSAVPESLFGNKLCCEVSVIFPRALGTVTLNLLKDQVWSLTRLGKASSLDIDQVLDRLDNFRDVLMGYLRLSLRGEKEALAEFENATRHLGAAIKSAIRKEKSASRPLYSLSRFEVIFESLLLLEQELLAIVESDVIKDIIAKLDEFVLMALEQTSATLAGDLRSAHSGDHGEYSGDSGAHSGDNDAERDVSGQAFSRACRLGAAIRERIVSKGYIALHAGSSSEHNEEYLLRWRELKLYFLSVLYLDTSSKQPSVLWVDFVGMSMAGLAMIVAVLLMWIAERSMGRFTIQLLVVLTLSYILKDRIKEWGKRYIIPLVNYPHKMYKHRYSQKPSLKSLVVGRSDEWFRVEERKPSSQVEYTLRRNRILAQTASEPNPFLSLADSHDAGPENVFSVKRETWVNESNWRTVARSTNRLEALGVSALEDRSSFVQLQRISLAEFCRRISRSNDQYSVFNRETGLPQVVQCPHVWRLRLKVRLSKRKMDKTSTSFASSILKRIGQVFSRLRGTTVDVSANEDGNSAEQEILDQRFYVFIDADGIRRITRRF